MKIYLAVPYTGMENDSFIKANRKAAELMAQGCVVFSPISHSHPIATQCNLPGGFDYWEKFNYSFIEWCDEVWVLMLDGWQESKGVTSEMKIAKKLNKPIKFVSEKKQDAPLPVRERRRG